MRKWRYPDIYPFKQGYVKQIVLKLTHKAEVILSNSVATKNRPLPFRLVVLIVCAIDLAVMIYFMINLMK